MNNKRTIHTKRSNSNEETKVNLSFNTNLLNVRTDRLEPLIYSERLMRATNDVLTTTFQIMTRGAPINGIEISIQQSAEVLQLASNNANDTVAGTGLRTILIAGVDASWAEQIEIINLNGTTPVSTLLTWRGVNDITGIGAGTNKKNFGDISFTNSTDTFTAGEPDTVLFYCIKATWSVMNGGVLYVPIDCNYYAANYIVNTSATEAKPVEAEVFVEPFGLPIQTIAIQTFTTAASYELKAFPPIPPKSIVSITGRNTSAGQNNFIVWFQFLCKK